MTTSYVGTHPTGRRYYARSRTGVPLAFAVFTWRSKREPRWECARLVEDRPYPGERHRVDGAYVPYPGDMPPRAMAEECATWYREVLEYPAEAVAVVELRPADGRRTS